MGDFCFGIDFTTRSPIWVYGWIVGCYNANVYAEGRQIAAQYDITLASTGGVGTILSSPRSIMINNRTIATEFDWFVGTYQGFIIGGSQTVRTSF